MLNYIWLTLIALGILSAVYFDSSDGIQNTYRNGQQLELKFDSLGVTESGQIKGNVFLSSQDFRKYYGVETGEDITVAAEFIEGGRQVVLNIDAKSPKIWSEIAANRGEADDILAEVISSTSVGNGSSKILVILEEASFLKLKAVSDAVFEYAGIAVKIALGLIGIMALWLGIMKIAEKAGLITILARTVKPVTKYLFPKVPSDHPAIGAMIMNISANMLGLGNAATPFGIKAMEELDTLNKSKGTATNAMCTFLAINTAGLTFIPATAIAIRASAGSANPAIIIGTSFFGALCATITGILAAKIFEKFTAKNGGVSQIWVENKRFFTAVLLLFGVVLVLGFSGAFTAVTNSLGFIDAALFRRVIEWVSILAIPLIIFIFVVFGIVKKVKIYEEFVDGAKEGFEVAVKIIPYLVAMLAAIGIFRAGGAMDLTISAISPVTDFLGFPAEALPMALMRPLSGSGSLGIMAEIISNYGADSFIGILVSTIMGSTETTLYVLAVYFGAVNIKKIRHAAAAGLIADAAGILGALWIVKMLFSG